MAMPRTPIDIVFVVPQDGTEDAYFFTGPFATPVSTLPRVFF
jgi:hypothetical protein